MSSKNFDLTKINLKDLEEKTSDYVDDIFINAVQCLLSKNIIPKNCKVLDMQNETVLNQQDNAQKVAIISIPHLANMRFSESNLNMFKNLSLQHPETFIDRWTDGKTENYEYIIALDISANQTSNEISKKLTEICSIFEMQDLKTIGISEDEIIDFKEKTSLSALFPELDWNGHHELVGRTRVWVANKKHNLTDEEIRERILEKITIPQDRVLDENNQLWERYHYEKHQKFLEAYQTKTK